MANKKLKAKDLVLDVYKDSRNFYNDNATKFDEYWKLSRGIPLKKKKKFNRFVPFIPAAIDLILPRLSGRLPIFDVVGVTEDDNDNAQTMKELVDFYLNKTDFHDFEIKLIKQAMIYGTAVAQIGWDLQKRSVHPDLEPDENGKVIAKSPDALKDEPTFTIRPIESVFPHRKKIHMQDEWPIIIKEEVSRRELKNDPNIDNAALGQVGEAKTEDDFFFDQKNKKLSQNNLNDANPTNDEDNDILVKLTYWGKYDGEEHVITVVNFDTVVRMERNPFWHQMKPFVKLDYQPESQQFFAEGLVAELRDSQLELNEIRNVRSKARSVALKTPLLVDRSANINLDELKWEHSAVWSYDPTQNSNPIVPVQIDGRLLEMQNEERQVQEDMQLRSGMNDVTIGADNTGIAGGDTATGAAIASEQTSLRFKTQALMIDQAIKELGEMMLWNIKQFVDRPKAFKIVGEEGFEWREYNPEDMRQFIYDFVVSPMSTFVEPKAAKRDSLILVKQLYADDPSIDQDKLDRMILDAYDINSEQIKKPQDVRVEEDQYAEIEQLADAINSPEFGQLPPEDQQALLMQLEQAKSRVEGGQQQLPAPTESL